MLLDRVRGLVRRKAVLDRGGGGKGQLYGMLTSGMSALSSKRYLFLLRVFSKLDMILSQHVHVNYEKR